MIRKIGSRTLQIFGLQRRKWVDADVRKRVKAALRGQNELPEPECPDCRALDTVCQQRDIARFLVTFASDGGEGFEPMPVWKLPSTEGTRFAIAVVPNSAFVAELCAAAAARGLACLLHKVKVTPNLYEFDGIKDLPTESLVLEFHPEPHCHAGRHYLPKRSITLELVEDRSGDVLVPVSGKGPRFYPREDIARLKVTPKTMDIVPPWPFSIDLVYTWVDSDDPLWQDEYVSHVDEIRAQAILTAAASAARWRSRDELRYSLRSVEMYAPFVRNIFIVTNGQKPHWLKDHPKVKVVAHTELYPDPSVLPSFNSNSIETVLHRIPGLAEHFLYLNDDFFFSNICTPEDFFSIGGLSKLFFSRRFLDARPVSPKGRATVACHKTTRDLLQAHFGLGCSQKFQHAPHALRKSILYKIEDDFSAELLRTRSNRVRSPDDLALALLYGYYALYSGEAQKSKIAYTYIELGNDDIEDSFAKLTAREIKVFCLNDSDSEDGLSKPEELMVQQALKVRYPVPAAWEIL